MPRFTRPARQRLNPPTGAEAPVDAVQQALNASRASIRPPLSAVSLPGPTGESNRLTAHGRGTILCLGPTADLALRQARIVRGAGCSAVAVAPGIDGAGTIPGHLNRAALSTLTGIDGVALASDEDDMRAARRALAARDGPIVPLFGEDDLEARAVIERHICVDTTAAGGNARLLAQSS